MRVSERGLLTSWLQAEVERLADARQPRALVVFDVLDDWFHGRDFDCRAAVGTASGDVDSPTVDRQTLALSAQDAAPAAPRRLDLSMQTLEAYAEQAGSSDPHEAASQLQILLLGAVVCAGSGDDRAAKHARSLAELLFEGSPR
jgi:hypothetical protein